VNGCDILNIVNLWWYANLIEYSFCGGMPIYGVLTKNHGTRFLTALSEPQVRDSIDIPTDPFPYHIVPTLTRFLTASSEPQVGDSHGVPTLMDQGA